MTIYEYITKNLPNLNWNILPQIFEDNEVELTEDIKKYLKETPENTNWNLLKNIINKYGDNQQSDDGYKKFIYGGDRPFGADGSDFQSMDELWAFCQNTPEKLIVTTTFDEGIYVYSPSNSSTGAFYKYYNNDCVISIYSDSTYFQDMND